MVLCEKLMHLSGTEHGQRLQNSKKRIIQVSDIDIVSCLNK